MRALARLGRRFSTPYRSVFPDTAAKLVEHGAVLVDVRDEHEWAAGHPPRARNIPVAQLPARLAELPGERPVIAVSKSGRRAKQAATVLAEQGIDASHLTGGLVAWLRAGLPLVAYGGRRGTLS